MKPIEINPVVRSRPIGSDAARAVSGTPGSPGHASASPAEPGRATQLGMVTRSDALSAGAAPPVDSDRVAQIRTAVKDGSYPLLPTNVADAMIAASLILIEGKKDR